VSTHGRKEESSEEESSEEEVTPSQAFIRNY
jgi:hypothetical protein